jgi:hypothetical protein|tara:strand:+ start:2760 stop:2954 length:195 start_codon:yes stop_codon:yes gene_type:complete
VGSDEMVMKKVILIILSLISLLWITFLVIKTEDVYNLLPIFFITLLWAKGVKQTMKEDIKRKVK